MQNQISMKYLAANVLAFLLLASPGAAEANEAQYHVCGVGLNLGQAASREYLFGAEFGGEPPGDQVGYIGMNVTNAIGHAEAAETLFPGIQSTSGGHSASQFIDNLSGYMTARTGMNYRHRANHLGSLAGNYKERVSYTFVSHRNPPFVRKPVCDTKLFDACYHFGYASTAAAGDNETVKLSSIGAMRTAINEGLELAGDRRPISSVEYICCSMGSAAAWSGLLSYNSQTPHSTFVTDTSTIMQIARDAKLAPGACGVHHGDDPLHRPDRTRRPPSGPREGGDAARKWHLEATRINPKNEALHSTRGQSNWETNHSCNLSATSLGIREETIWSDGSREGYEYQFVFDRPPDQIQPGQQFVVNVRGSGTQRGQNRRWIGQFEMRAKGLGVRPTADRVLRITPPDVEGGYEFTVPGSPPDELVIHAFLWNEGACAVDFVYRKAN